jgi:hypothetical protein
VDLIRNRFLIVGVLSPGQGAEAHSRSLTPWRSPAAREAR